MKKEVKEKWIADLRSGEFPQTTCVLHSNDGYCCLGVLVNQFVDEWATINGSLAGRCHPKRDGVSLGGSGHLNVHFVREVGLEDKTGDLMRMNDEFKKSFSEIADWIEQNIEAE